MRLVKMMGIGMQVVTWTGRLVALLVLCVLGYVGYGFYAKLAITHTWDVAGRENVAIDPSRSGDPFVGLALSGGGGRAAVFGAEGMQVLAENGLLSAVTHVSSVSGGGFPAGYMAINALPSDETDVADYFDRLQTVLSRDFVDEIFTRQLYRPNRWASPSRRLISLREVLEDDGGLGQPFLSINARPAKFSDITDGRRYYFNTISYDFGRRFTLSNAAIEQPAALDGFAVPQSLRTLSFSRACTVFDIDDCAAISTDPQMPLSVAVAISAGFPPVMGPASIKVVGVDEDVFYWHLGDGGVLENTGVETLREAYLTAKLSNPYAAPATIYSFDAGKRLEGETAERNADLSLWSPWKPEVTRMVDSVLEYAIANREAFEAELERSAPTGISLVSFNYLNTQAVLKDAKRKDVQLEKLKTILIGACAVETMDQEAALAQIRNVSTSYTISACDAALIRWSARLLVEDWIDRQ